jgi:hypothetical protein
VYNQLEQHFEQKRQ